MDASLKAIQLEAPFVIKNFVVNEEKCNYEIYLLELLNHSAWFSDHYPGGFTAPPSESKGECDAIGNGYELDFKLLESKTMLQSSSLRSMQIAKTADGCVVFSKSKSQSTSGVTFIGADFENRSLSELKEIRKCNFKSNGLENDIATVLGTLETQKNLMLFFPYQYTYGTPHDFSDSVHSIADTLSRIFCCAFEYRNEFAAHYDTYLTCVYDDVFLIFAVENDKLCFCDSVRTSDIPTFVRLSEYLDW